jgi:enterochelin esterase family protein
MAYIGQRLHLWLISIYIRNALIAIFTTFFLFFSSDLSATSRDEALAYHPKGKLFSYCFKSRILKNKRDIWVYVPASYRCEETPYPLLIVFDGQAYTSQLIPGPTILDHLIAEGQIPPLVAVFISSIDQRRRNQELPCYAPFIDSLMQELLPWLHRHYFITFNPSQIIVAAAYAALRYPQQFGNVLSQSGAFWWQLAQNDGPWLIRQFETQPLLPLRFYLDVGNQETEYWEGKMSMLDINRDLRDLLRRKGYPVAYYEFQGGHDYECWRKTFAIGLVALIKKKER